RILRPPGEPCQMAQVINEHDDEADCGERPGPRRTGEQRDRQARQRDQRNDRETAALDLIQLARRPYPAPRTVSIRRSCPVGSSALRRRRMWTSTVRSSMYT